MLFLTGHHNSGKTTTASWLVDSYGFMHVETSSLVRGLYKTSGSREEFGSWAQKHAGNLDGHILSVVSDKRNSLVREGKAPDLVITGHRQLGGIRHTLANIEPVPGREGIVLYFESDHEDLYHRQLGRPERNQRLTFAEFTSTLIAYDQEMGVEKIKEAANAVIENNSSLAVLFSRVLLVLNNFGYGLETRVPISLERSV